MTSSSDYKRSMAEVFSDDGIPEQKPLQMETFTEFTPAPGPWSTDTPESKVFHRGFRFADLDGKPLEIRIGRGGHLYSIQSPAGEMVPPQWRPKESGHQSPWNDEVFQAVSVTHDPKTIFVHQSGCYLDSADEKAYYSPPLAESWNPEKKEFTFLSWGTVPQYSAPIISDILYYVRYRFVAPGILETTYGFHNFGKRRYEWFNAPWGGVRQTTLGEMWLANTQGELESFAGKSFGDNSCPFLSNTGGWFAFAQEDPKPDRYALGLVFGQDQGREEKHFADGRPLMPNASILRFGRAGSPDVELAKKTRNYLVYVVIPKFALDQGDTAYWRSYMVFGNLDRVKQVSAELVGQVSFGALEFPESDTPSVALGKAREDAGLDPNAKCDPSLSDDAKLFAKPVRGTHPVFALRLKSSSKWVITADPQQYAKLPENGPDGKALYSVPKSFSDIRLLGFGK